MFKRSAGYALIEMLVSLAIIGIASALMVAGLGASHRIWERVDSEEIRGESLAGAQTLLRDRLERAFPATRYDAIPAYSDFQGTSNTITFLAPPRDVHAPTGLQRYQLSLAVNGDLLLSSSSELTLNPKVPTENLVLMHGVQGLDITYFGLVPPDTAPDWKPQWVNLATLPKLMRIRVQFAAQDPRVWPELLIKPFATVDSACVLVVLTGKCRGRQ